MSVKFNTKAVIKLYICMLGHVIVQTVYLVIQVLTDIIALM